jgi:predicted phage replisome organizer
MAEVKWIKFIVGTFDGTSFKRIKKAKIGGISYRDKLTAVWFELLDLAGKCNRDGFLIDKNELAYRTYEDIATMIDREEKEIELCMQFFISEKMIEIIDDVYLLSNWVNYQNVKGLDDIRKEQNRIRQQRYYYNQKNLTREPNANLTQPNATDIDIDKELDIDIDNKEDKPRYETITNQINSFSTDTELREILKQYVKMREKIRKKLTNYAFYLVLKKLTKLSTNIEAQNDILNQSITNSWQDIYELKTNYQSKYVKKEASLPDWYEKYQEDLKNTPKKEKEMSKEEIEKILEDAKKEF